MTPAQARGLQRRWRAGDTTRDEIDDALQLLAHLLDQRGQHGALMADLRDAFGPVKPALAGADDWLVRNNRDRQGNDVRLEGQAPTRQER